MVKIEPKFKNQILFALIPCVGITIVIFYALKNLFKLSQKYIFLFGCISFPFFSAMWLLCMSIFGAITKSMENWTYIVGGLLVFYLMSYIIILYEVLAALLFKVMHKKDIVKQKIAEEKKVEQEKLDKEKAEQEKMKQEKGETTDITETIDTAAEQKQEQAKPEEAKTDESTDESDGEPTIKKFIGNNSDEY